MNLQALLELKDSERLKKIAEEAKALTIEAFRKSEEYIKLLNSQVKRK